MYTSVCIDSQICLKRQKKVLMEAGTLMKVESFAEYSILQHFRPALLVSDNRY